MRYKPQPSIADKCLDTTTDTITYFRKRPISLIVLFAVLIWMILVVSWSSNSSRAPSTNTNPNPLKSNEVQPPPEPNPRVISQNNNGAPTAERPKLDKEAIANKVSNAKKVLVTYGQNCCTAAKVKRYLYPSIIHCISITHIIIIHTIHIIHLEKNV